MFDVLLGVTGLKSFQKYCPASENVTAEKFICLWKIDVPFTRWVLSCGFGGGVKPGYPVKTSAVALLAKLTKMTFDLLEIQWHFALSFWKNMQLEKDIVIFESQTVSCNKNGCCAASSMHLQE